MRNSLLQDHISSLDFLDKLVLTSKGLVSRSGEAFLQGLGLPIIQPLVVFPLPASRLAGFSGLLRRRGCIHFANMHAIEVSCLHGKPRCGRCNQNWIDCRPILNILVGLNGK